MTTRMVLNAWSVGTGTRATTVGVPAVLWITPPTGWNSAVLGSNLPVTASQSQSQSRCMKSTAVCEGCHSCDGSR